MKFFRNRAPSIKTVLVITHAKKAVKTAVGITAAMKPVRVLGNVTRTVKRHVGYYGEPMKIARNGLPRPLGFKTAAGILVPLLMTLVALAIAGFVLMLYH